MPSLEQRIENQDTELQRSYNISHEIKHRAEKKIDKLKAEIEDLEDAVLHHKGILAQCERRAREQGYDNSIFNTKNRTEK